MPSIAIISFLLPLCSVAQQIDIGAPPGRLVAIEGRRLHLNCNGNGSPTVILEAGASSFALDWSLVQPAVARSNRVCSYGRAGSGWSDLRPDVETPARVAADLNALLKAAGERPPYILVGASFGAIFVRTFQLDYPKEVAGFVLVDPATEERLLTICEGHTVPIGSLTADQVRSSLPDVASVPIPRRPVQTGVPFNRLPSSLYDLRMKLDQRLIASFPPSVSMEIVHESKEGERMALARLLENRSSKEFPIGDLPFVALTRAENMTPGIVESHTALARLSRNSRHSVVPKAGHEIHLYVPDAVVQAIQDVSSAIRLGRRLSAQ